MANALALSGLGLLLASSCSARRPEASAPELAHVGPPRSASFTGMSLPFVLDELPERRRYVAYRTDAPLVIDGLLDEAEWASAPATALFVDIAGAPRPTPRFATYAKLLWDENYFYVGADLEEPHLWGTLTERDSVIYLDNDFEVFIDPDGDTQNYYELELNALGTEWDLLLVKPYRDGGPPLHEFDTPGLRSAVHCRGTLNDPRDVDEGWSLEIAIPWAALGAIADCPTPPHDGDTWWVNFSRVQWQLDVNDEGYSKRRSPEGHSLAEDNWVWSPQGVIAMHEPESWGLVLFAKQVAGQAIRTFDDPADLDQRVFLRAVYRAQRKYRRAHKRFARSPQDLGITNELLAGRTLELFVSPSGYEARLTWRTLRDSGPHQSSSLRIDELGHLW